MRLPDTRPITTPGAAGFLIWLQRESQPGGLLPGVAQHVRSVAPHVMSQAALHGLGDDTTDVTSTFITPTVEAPAPDFPAAIPTADGGNVGGWADTFAKVVTPVIQGAEQVQLFNVQLARAQRGLPPLNTSQLRVPGVGVNVGLSSNTGLLLAGVAAVIGGAILFGGRRRA